MKIKYTYFLLLLLFCFQVKAQVYVNVCVSQAAPLSLSQGSINNESCLNSLNGSATVNASGGNTPYSYSWNTAPAQLTQTAIGLAAGNYIVTVTDASGCSDTISFTLTRNPDPIATFTNTTECNSSPTQFNDNSTSSSGAISTWDWDFGDGSPSNFSSNPSYTFTNGGNYNVTLIVNNSFGCADTITKPVQVYHNPIAGFTHSDVCLEDTMHFTNTSTVNLPASILSYLWVYGDGGSTSNLVASPHYFSAAGAYTISLVAITTDGCSGVVNNLVNTFDPPVSAFSSSNACLNDSAVFTNTTIDPTMGTTANWSWDFGDGSPFNTNEWSPQHLYSATGNYQVILITQSSNLGCADTLQTTITVFPIPLADYSFTNVCLNEPMNFYDSSFVSNDSIVNWSWNFGDSAPLITSQNPSHIYSNPGTYIVTLICSSNNGCNATISKSVVVHPLPSAQFNCSNVCLGTSAQFNNFSSILPTDTIQSFFWSFGDGSQLNTNQNPSHLYADAGFYPVQLVIVSYFGCSDSISKTNIVNPKPIVNFNTIDTTGCEPLCTNFQNSSSIVTGVNAQWLWSFGDGSPASTSQDGGHCYMNDSVFFPINFTVSLTATSDSGCVSTKSINNYIHVYPKPSANFSVEPGTASIINPIISITDLSEGANFWYWNFGDLDTTSSANPQPHKYADSGTYIITLVTSTLFNCFDTAFQTIIIEPDFLFYIPSGFSPDDDGVNDYFSGKGVFIKDFEMLIFDRWGNLIFRSDNINKPWDGKANNGSEIAKPDVYVYSFNVTDFHGKKHNYRGIVTLVK